MKYKLGLKVLLRNKVIATITKVKPEENKFWIALPEGMGSAWMYLSTGRLGGAIIAHPYDVVKVINRKQKIKLP